MEWLAYAEIEPFGEDRADFRAAMICSVIYNARFGKQGNPTPFKPKDFMIDYVGAVTNPDVKVKPKPRGGWQGMDWRVLKAIFKGLVEEQNRG